MTGQSRSGVVLLHGLAGHPALMRRIGAALGRAGFATSAVGYPSRRLPLSSLVDHIHPAVSRFARDIDGDLHFVGHSLGGLLARAYIARHRPNRLGRLVMLGPPNAGSEVADLMARMRLDGFIIGPAGAHLTTRRSTENERLLGTVDYPVGVIAGDRAIEPFFSKLVPRPNDGKVSIAATRLAGMTDHIVVPVPHALMNIDRRVILQVVTFVERGAFAR